MSGSQVVKESEKILEDPCRLRLLRSVKASCIYQPETFQASGVSSLYDRLESDAARNSRIQGGTTIIVEASTVTDLKGSSQSKVEKSGDSELWKSSMLFRIIFL